MKRFLLYLSALFLSVSFATAQTSFEITPSNGDVAAGAKSCEWNYAVDNNPAGLKIVAIDASGQKVNAISATSGASSKLKFSVFGVLEGTETYSRESTTFTVSVNENYLITGYSMVYTASSANKITVSDEFAYSATPSSRTEPQTMSKDNISAQSIRFNLSAPSFSNSYAVQINSFTIYVQKVGGEAPVEYTVSATANPAEGGVATVNGVAEATTTGSVELEAVPAYGYKFVRWTVEGNEVSTAAQYTTAVNSDVQYVAVFEKLTDTIDWYAAIAKPTFGKVGNTTFIKAATLAGDVNTEVAGVLYEYKDGKTTQYCVTNAIEVAAGAEFDLNITYQLNWGDLAIYQIDNDGATKEYGYYYGSWEPNGSTEKVAQNIANDGISITEVVDGACTVTYPIAITENHNPGDVIVVRAITGKINNATNSAFEQNIVEGGYVDFLFVVTEETAEESYTLTVTDAGYATLFLDFNAAIPADVKAYTVTEVNDGYVTLTQVTGVLPANTGVIVKAAKGEYNFVSSTDEAADVTGNLLKGSVTDKNIEGEAYVLGIVDGEVGLYKAAMTGTSWKNNANKAYLPMSAVANKSAEFFGFDWDGTTAIENVEVENEVKTIYDLTGRRVEEITAPGIYIVNGVKRVVR